MPRFIPSRILPLLLLLPGAAAWAQQAGESGANTNQAIASQARADQAACRKEPAAAQAACLRTAKEKEQQARAQLKARNATATAAPAGRATEEAAAGRNISGRGSVGAGQYGHVAPNGSVMVGGRKDMPQASGQAMRQADDLRASKLPSNQPVDVTRAAREVQGQARP